MITAGLKLTQSGAIALVEGNRLEFNIEMQKLANNPRYSDFDDLDLLMSRFEEAGRRINQRWRWNTSIGLEVVLKRLANLGLGSNERLISVASARLEKVMSGEGFLSSDQAHARALGDTLSRLEELKRDLSSGAFA